MLYEHVLVDAPTIESFYQAVWAGGHAALPNAPAGTARSSLVELLQSHGRSSCLITDEPRVADLALARSFSRAEGILRQSTSEPAETPEATNFARLLATALSAIEREPSDLVWIHSAGMFAAWDAPTAWREQFCDEDDPPPPAAVVPPAGPLAEDWEPDDLQGWVWAYGAQVALLDWGLAAVLESWEQIREPALLVLMGTRGFALGEHGLIGRPTDGLHSEHLHVPLIVVANRDGLAATRCQQLVQPYHLWQTLVNWFGTGSVVGEANDGLFELPIAELQAKGSSWPPLAVAQLHDHWALRTPAWHACVSPRSWDADHAAPRVSRSGSRPCQLYLKPDDRWEVNDVAIRCPDVVERFLELHRAIEQLPAGANFEALMPLAPDLQFPPE
jgi:arylsulfatase A-like enzyme